MLIITKENNSIKVVGQNNPTYPYSGTLVYPLNSVTVVTDQSDMAVFRSALNNDVLFTGLIDDITISGSTVTKEDIGTKFGAISNSSSSGGGTGGGGAVDSVNGQTGTVVLSASDVNAYSKTESDAKYATKEEIPSTDTLATKQELAGEVSEREKQDSALGGMIAGETEAREQAITNLTATVQGKLDTATYNSEKATFETKENAAATYQPKGSYLTSIPEEYVTDTELNEKNYATQAWVTEQGYLTEHQDISGLATKEELNGKQNTLVSGTNIKTINGNTILGEGNIQIETTGGGITDAPSDDKTYGRKNGAWSEITQPDLSNYALKSEVPKRYVTEFTGTDNGFQILQNGSSDTRGGLTFGEGFTVVNLRNTPSVSIDTETIATKEQLNGKQDTLVSGTNIKTVNGNSLLGSGDITIEGGGSDITAQYYSTSNGVQLSKDSLNLLTFAPGDNITFANSGSENSPIITISATGGGTGGGGTEAYDFKGTSRCAELTYDVVKEGVILQNITLSGMNITTNGVLITLAKFDNVSAIGFALLSEGKYSGTNKPFLAQVLFSNVGGATISKYVSTTPTVQEGAEGTETNYIYSNKSNSMYRAIAMASPGIVSDGEGGSTAGIVLRYWGDDVTNPLKFDYVTSTRGGMMRSKDKNKLDTLQTEWFGTQSQFDGLESKDENTLYFITEE